MSAPVFQRGRAVYLVIYLGLLYFPIVFIPLFSFNDSVYVTFPLKEFTLRWYQVLAANDGVWLALENSLIVAGVTAPMATLIGLMAAKATTRYHFLGRRIAIASLLMPLALPTVVSAVALLSLFSLTGIPLSLATIAAGHVLICTPFAYGVMASRLEGLNKDYELASLDMGEPPFWTFLRITVPLAMPGIVSSLLLTFIISFDEFILAFFLSSNSPTLPVFMWSQMRFPDRLPMVLALATALILVSVVFILCALLAGGRRAATDQARLT
jgi:spermidine/putrescine transport system permease protein